MKQWKHLKLVQEAWGDRNFYVISKQDIPTYTFQSLGTVKCSYIGYKWTNGRGEQIQSATYHETLQDGSIVVSIWHSIGD